MAWMLYINMFMLLQLVIPSPCHPALRQTLVSYSLPGTAVLPCHGQLLVYLIDAGVYQRLPDEAHLQTGMDWKRRIHGAHQNENKREAGFLPCWLLSL